MDLILKFLLTLAASVFIWKLITFFNRYRAWCALFASPHITPIAKTHPFWGHLHLLKEASDIYKYSKKTVDETQSKLLFFWVGLFHPIICAVHPDTVKVLLKSSEPKPTYQGSGYGALLPWLGD